MEQEILNALASMLPQHFTDVDFVAQQVENQCAGRVAYEIVDANVDGETLTQPTPELHAAVIKDMRDSGAERLECSLKLENGGWDYKFRRLIPEGTAEKIGQERKEREEFLWQSVFEARTQFLEDCLGEVPGDVKKLMNVHWVGGGIIDFEKCKMPGVRAVISSGLSNPDVPSGVKVVNFKVNEALKGNKMERTYEGQLQGSTPRFVPPFLAGYGYEVAILSTALDERIVYPLMWFIEQELQNDVDLLGRVNAYGGLTIEGLSLGEFGSSDFVLFPAVELMPSPINLPNGEMHTLIATAITREEMEFARKNGCGKLIEVLIEKGRGQLSVFGRKSVV